MLVDASIIKMSLCSFIRERILPRHSVTKYSTQVLSVLLACLALTRLWYPDKGPVILFRSRSEGHEIPREHATACGRR